MGIVERMKSSIIFSVIIFGMVISSSAQKYLPFRNDPLRKIGDKIYSLQPIYNWVKLPSTDRTTRPIPEWIGVTDNRRTTINYKVIGILPDGILLESSGERMISNNFDGSEQPDYDSHEPILLKNYPNQEDVLDGQIMNFLAIRSGSFQYVSADNSMHTIAAYDYGKPYVAPPPTPEQIKFAQDAALKRAESSRQNYLTGETNTVRWLLSQATNGVASVQCDLGEHYISGLGCETNLTLGIYWLTQAANQGSLEASNKIAVIQR